MNCTSKLGVCLVPRTPSEDPDTSEAREALKESALFSIFLLLATSTHRCATSKQHGRSLSWSFGQASHSMQQEGVCCFFQVLLLLWLFELLNVSSINPTQASDLFIKLIPFPLKSMPYLCARRPEGFICFTHHTQRQVLDGMLSL